MKAHCKVEGEKCFSHVRYRLLRKKEGNRGERKDEISNILTRTDSYRKAQPPGQHRKGQVKE